MWEGRILPPLRPRREGNEKKYTQVQRKKEEKSSESAHSDEVRGGDLELDHDVWCKY